MRVSIIIPTLNEEDQIGRLLEYIRENYCVHEIIVIDGGSSDSTVSIALKTAEVIRTSKGRGHQLNIGANRATSEILWFLHADTLPHPSALQMILQTMTDKNIIGGAFEYTFFGKSLILKVLSRYSNFKNRILKRIYGDMGIFVRKDVFHKIKGFPESLLMEDFAISTLLRKEGEIKILPQKIETSPRDWEKMGILNKIVKDSLIKTAYRLNFNNQRLYNWYYGVKND